MAKKSDRGWKLAQGTMWRARSGARVVIDRNDHGRIWFRRVDLDEVKTLMLTKGQFAATFPQEIV